METSDHTRGITGLRTESVKANVYMKRIVTSVAVLTVSAVLLSAIVQRAAWGYWFARPNIAASITDINVVLGVATLPPSVAFDRSTVLSAFNEARERCTPPSNECLEGRIVVAAGVQSADLKPMPFDLIQAIWSKEQRDRPLPSFPNSTQDRSPPIAGVATHFRSARGEFIALGYRTSEIANDSYLYSEALYQVAHDGIEPVRRARFRFDVAGLEDLTFPILAVLNLIVLSVAILLGIGVRRLVRRNSQGEAAI